MNNPDARVTAALPRLRRLAHAFVCEPDKADELLEVLVEEATTGVGADARHLDNPLELIRLLRMLWINRREGWQATLPLEATTEIARAMQAMAFLPRNQREAVALVVIDGLDYRDAADIAGVSRVTLTERLLSARKTLTTLLAEVPA